MSEERCTKFEFTFSDSFLIEMFRRYRRCRKLARYTMLLKILFSLLLGALIAICILSKSYMGAVIILAFLLLIAFAHRIDEWFMIRGFRKSPFRKEEMCVQLSPDGFAASGTRSNVQLTWTVFTEARRFDDGFLLFQGPGVFNWLPVGVITSGTVEQAANLIRTNVADYKVI